MLGAAEPADSHLPPRYRDSASDKSKKNGGSKDHDGDDGQKKSRKPGRPKKDQSGNDTQKGKKRKSKTDGESDAPPNEDDHCPLNSGDDDPEGDTEGAGDGKDKRKKERVSKRPASKGSTKSTRKPTERSGKQRADVDHHQDGATKQTSIIVKFRFSMLCSFKGFKSGTLSIGFDRCRFAGCAGCG